MPQLLYEHNYPIWEGSANPINEGTLSFVPFHIRDSISLNTLNFGVIYSNVSAGTASVTFGLYSLNGAFLSLSNSMSCSLTQTTVSNLIGMVSMINTSATQNMTPGTWFFGILVSLSSNTNFSLAGARVLNPENAFAGAFMGGRMTDSTNQLPSVYATSNLDVTGQDAFFTCPHIIISA